MLFVPSSLDVLDEVLGFFGSRVINAVVIGVCAASHLFHSVPQSALKILLVELLPKTAYFIFDFSLFNSEQTIIIFFLEVFKFVFIPGYPLDRVRYTRCCNAGAPFPLISFCTDACAPLKVSYISYPLALELHFSHICFD